ncbi:hypothetical protein V9T40_010008 [Parthenolecanium corni]|uniref:Uncharacterized protein n=1 Tax=Parthenolecanium corni TaxID=536013 RepID=A0AAN9Y702_9HEMI
MSEKKRKLKFTREILDTCKERIKNGESKRFVAKTIGVNEATLRKRLRLDTVPVTLGRFNHTFTPEQEAQLKEHICAFEKRHYGITKKKLMKFVFDFAEKNEISHRFNGKTGKAGKKFVYSFLKRNKLSFRQPEKISQYRASCFNRIQVDKFFENLKQLYEMYAYPPHRIFNMDESGISTVPNKLPKVVAPRGKKTVEKIAAADRGESMTVVCVCNPMGFPVPPALIMPRVRYHEQLYADAPIGAAEFHNAKGYMTSHIFLEWLEHFQSHVKATPNDKSSFTARQPCYPPNFSSCELF